MEVSFPEEGTGTLKTSHDNLHRGKITMIFHLNKLWDQFSISNHSFMQCIFSSGNSGPSLQISSIFYNV